jgi:hypothetical protein
MIKAERTSARNGQHSTNTQRDATPGHGSLCIIAVYFHYKFSHTLQVPFAFRCAIAAPTKHALPVKIVTPLQTIGA